MHRTPIGRHGGKRVIEQHLQILLDRYFDGALADDERAELERLLLSSPQARQAYWEFARLHADASRWGQEEWGRKLAEFQSPVDLETGSIAADSSFARTTPPIALVGWLGGQHPPCRRPIQSAFDADFSSRFLPFSAHFDGYPDGRGSSDFFSRCSLGNGRTHSRRCNRCRANIQAHVRHRSVRNLQWSEPDFAGTGRNHPSI